MKKFLVVTALVLVCALAFASCGIAGLANAAKEIQAKGDQTINREGLDKIKEEIDKLDIPTASADAPSASTAPKYTQEELAQFEGFILEDVFSEEEGTKGARKAMNIENQDIISDVYVKVNQNDMSINFVIKKPSVFTQKDYDEVFVMYKDLYENLFAQRLMLIPINLSLNMFDEKNNELYSNSAVLDVEKMKEIINDPNAQKIVMDDSLKRTAQEYVDVLNSDEIIENQKAMLGEGMDMRYLLENDTIICEVSFGDDAGFTKDNFVMTDAEKKDMFTVWLAEVQMSVINPEKYSLEYRYINTDKNETMFSAKTKVVE